MLEPRTRRAYAHCQEMARRHYENFPVASILLPRRLRLPVAAIYAFARTADDWADEGEHSADTRLAKLDAMGTAIQNIAQGQVAEDPIFIALAHAIHEHALPLEPFLDLLSAFTQDVTKTRYANFGEVMHYCRRSANPVGRLLLRLYQADDTRNLAHADAICSALQLINFLQDIHQDYAENDRIYLPEDDMRHFGVTSEQLGNKENTFALRQLVHFQAQRADKLLSAGAPLGSILKGRAGFEMRMILLGGKRILQRLQRQDNVFDRPRLTGGDRLKMLWNAFKSGFI